MNNGLKAGIIFLSGVAVGAVGTWFALKSHYRALADEEIESVKELARKKYKKYETEVKENKSKIEEINDEKKLLTRVIKDAGLTMYSNFSDPDEKEEGPQEDDSSVENRLYQSSPYFIDEEQYSTEALHYIKKELRYFAEDQTFCDENDQVFDESTMGSAMVASIVSSFEDMDDNFDMIYVRNDSMAEDYEIQYILNSYKTAILGEEEG